MAHTKFPLGPRVTVSVEKETISSAIVANSGKCWIAESIKKAVPSATHVAVDLSTTRFTDPERGLRYVYLTPYTAQLALLGFDEGTPPQPFRFVLKNAHVTRANVARARKTAAALKGREKQNEKRRAVRAEKRAEKAAGAAQLLPGTSAHAVPRRIGGRRPPQLRMLRQFGIRAFRGASRKRLEADVAIVAEAEELQRAKRASAKEGR